MTDCLWLREPQRRTALATVAGTRGPAFVLDKSIFHATSHAYRHPQPADRGEVWIGGDKRVITRVSWDRGELRHVVRGVVPRAGTAVRCILDAERRDDASSAHAAMHLVVSAFVRRRAGTLVDEPRVQGGRQFSLALRWPGWSPEGVRDLLATANAARSPSQEISIEYRPRDSWAGVDPQPYVDVSNFVPPEASVRLVRIGEASLLPCDGTLPARSGQVGRIVARRVQPGRDVVRIQFAVERPA